MFYRLGSWGILLTLIVWLSINRYCYSILSWWSVLTIWFFILKPIKTLWSTLFANNKIVARKIQITNLMKTNQEPDIGGVRILNNIPTNCMLIYENFLQYFKTHQPVILSLGCRSFRYTVNSLYKRYTMFVFMIKSLTIQLLGLNWIVQCNFQPIFTVPLWPATFLKNTCW